MPPVETLPAPVLVWGGGSGGVAAALQAARSGADTLLLTPGDWIGGMVSAAGVCAPDGNELSPWQSGLWGALLRALARAEPSGLDHNWVSCFGFSPSTAERLLRHWLAAEARLRWWRRCRLLQVERRGDRIVAVLVDHDGGLARVLPDLVIDGSDRGDLFPLAGAAFDLGWEARERTGEPSAPGRKQLEQDHFYREQPVQSPTWVVLAQLGDGSPAAEATARVNLPPPFSAACDRFGLERTLTYGRLPAGQVMLNWPLHGNDWHRDLERAFSDDPAQQTSLERDMQAHSLAFAQSLITASRGWLRPGTGFPSTSEAKAGAVVGQQSLALMPYWREGRRLVGLQRVLEQHLLPDAPGARIAPLPLAGAAGSDAIAVGNYANDHHYPVPDWPLQAKSCRWGGRWSGTPFAIPFAALVSAEVVNLLAADKCFSVSHIANGATRLQPLILNIGQVAGLAAALCLRHGRPPAELPVDWIQSALIDDPQAPAGPFPLWDTPWHHPLWRERQHRLRRDPSLLDQQGRLEGLEDDPFLAPAEPGEQLWQGDLDADGAGGYRLLGPRGPGGEPWPLITLEPALNRWLGSQTHRRAIRLIGCANPWGPWLRVSRLVP